MKTYRQRIAELCPLGLPARTEVITTEAIGQAGAVVSTRTEIRPRDLAGDERPYSRRHFWRALSAAGIDTEDKARALAVRLYGGPVVRVRRLFASREAEENWRSLQRKP